MAYGYGVDVICTKTELLDQICAQTVVIPAVSRKWLTCPTLSPDV